MVSLYDIGNFLDSINPKNFSLTKKNKFDEMQGYQSAQFQKDFISPNIANARPYNATRYLNGPDGAKIPIYMVNPNIAYELAESVADVRAVLQDIVREVFRNGIKVKPMFKFRCGDCLKEYQNIPYAEFVPLEQAGYDPQKQKMRCDDCGNTDDWDKPDPKNRIILETFAKDPINRNDQNLTDILKGVERDLDIIDGSYTLVSRDYVIETLSTPDPVTGATKRASLDVDKSKISEILRIDPRTVGIIANNSDEIGFSIENVPQYICPDMKHRQEMLKNPVCPKCGIEAFSAFLSTNAIPNGLPNNAGENHVMIYARHEVIWIPGKYVPGPLFGKPPIDALWKKIFSLMYQDEYMWKYFDKDRPAKGLLLIGSKNPESATAFQERQRQGADVEPYSPRALILKTDDVKKAVQYIDLTPNLKELELLDLRKELRQMILAMYGLQPLYLGEAQKGALGNESLQVTLSNRAMKDNQVFLNEKFLKKLTDMFKIDDWKIVLEDVEELDKLRTLQVKGEEIKNAQILFAMAFDVQFDGNGELIISQKPNPERLLQMTQGAPGENVAEGKSDKVKKPNSSKEKSTNFDGQPNPQRPSDKGGTGQGSPASGDKTSLSNKAETSSGAIEHLASVSGKTPMEIKKKIEELQIELLTKENEGPKVRDRYT